ncbi:MAG: hypothetical protein AAGI52_00310 [Bacteroidota bacterium]
MRPASLALLIALLVPASGLAQEAVLLPDSLDQEGVQMLSDSARAVVDSAAVAALTDTTASVAEVLGESTPVDLLGRTLFEVWGGARRSLRRAASPAALRPPRGTGSRRRDRPA